MLEGKEGQQTHLEIVQRRNKTTGTIFSNYSVYI